MEGRRGQSVGIFPWQDGRVSLSALVLETFTYLGEKKEREKERRRRWLRSRYLSLQKGRKGEGEQGRTVPLSKRFPRIKSFSTTERSVPRWKRGRGRKKSKSKSRPGSTPSA